VQDRTSITTRLSYAASDVAGQFLFCWVVWYVPYFYTDICRIPAAAVGTILLATRFLDALDAPLWGMVMDRTRCKWGKSRPWFLWLCLPFAVFGVLSFVFSGAAMTLPFSMLADTVDFGEWKTGVRAAGLLTAIGGAFCFKVGAGLGGALPMWLLHLGGYVEGKEQPPAVMAALDWGVIGIPAVCFALALVPALFYGHFERLEPQIRAALEQRRTEQFGKQIG